MATGIVEKAPMSPEEPIKRKAKEAEECADGEKEQPVDQPKDQDIRVIGSERDLSLLEYLER